MNQIATPGKYDISSTTLAFPTLLFIPLPNKPLPPFALTSHLSHTTTNPHPHLPHTPRQFSTTHHPARNFPSPTHNPSFPPPRRRHSRLPSSPRYRPMYKTQTRVGGDLVRYPVCFSDDEKCIFSCVGGIIKANNAHTGALQGEYRGHTARVSGVFLNPLNTLQLYSTSHDGTIRRWDPSEGQCLQTYDIGIPVLTGSIAAGHHLYVALDPYHYTKFLPQKSAPQDLPTAITMSDDTDSQPPQPSLNQEDPRDVTMPSPQDERRAITKANHASQTLGENAIYLCSFDLLTPHNARISTEFTTKQPENTLISADPDSPLQLLFTMNSFTAMARSRTGDLLCAVGKNEIHVYSKKLRKHGMIRHPLNITCVDVHPKQDLIAVGDTSGKITIYLKAAQILSHSVDDDDNSSTTAQKDFISKRNNQHARHHGASALTTSILHWHSQPVRSIKFSVDGNYLLSGGYETVLVTWQLSNMSSHFLPKFSSFINHIAISPKGGVYAISCGDNSIQTLGAFNSQLKHVAHGVNVLNATNRLIPSTAVVENLADPNKVVLLTDEGQFQIFDVAHDTHVATLQLIPRASNLAEDHVIMHRKGMGDSAAELDARQQRDIQGREHLDISNVVLSPDGNWSCGFISSPTYSGLRIWGHTASTFSPQTAFVPRSIWNDPHKHAVISGVFSSDSSFFISGHQNGKVRIWGKHGISHELLLQQQQQNSTSPLAPYMKVRWGIENTLDYQDLLPSKIAISTDNTLLAIGFGNCFTLWSIDVHNDYAVTFLFSHAFPGTKTEILNICFLPQYPTIHVATQHGLYTFDLLTLSCVGTYFCNIAGMVTHPTLPLLFVVAVVPHLKNKHALAAQAAVEELKSLTSQSQRDQEKINKLTNIVDEETAKAKLVDEDSDYNSDGEDSDDQGKEDTKDDDYLGDAVDLLLQQQPNGITPGAIGRDQKCPIYRRLFKYRYRNQQIFKFMDEGAQKAPSLRNIPTIQLAQAERALGVKLPSRTSKVQPPQKISQPQQTGDVRLRSKPTKECCLLIFGDNRCDSPSNATSLFDVLLTKTKNPNSQDNPYNTSCYESSITITRDFLIYLNRSRELTLIPITPFGLSLTKSKSSSTSMQWAINGVLKDVYNLETHSAKLENKDHVAFALDKRSTNTNNDLDYTSQTSKPDLTRLLTSLANTPTHQITSLSAIYEQFMTPFLPPALESGKKME